MKFFSHNDTSSINSTGTHLVGHIQARRCDLECAFGPPEEFSNDDGDGKITTHWELQFADGTVCTIYDWKRYEDGAPSQNELYGWHIGAHKFSAVGTLHDQFREHFGLNARAAA